MKFFSRRLEVVIGIFRKWIIVVFKVMRCKMSFYIGGNFFNKRENLNLECLFCFRYRLER